MPQEFSRTTARKTIVLPDGDTIDVPCITKISFLDPNERAQETQQSLDNSRTDSSRSVHVDQVHSVEVDEDGVATSTTAPTAGTESLYVERIDTWRSIDPNDRYQETQTTLDNTTGNDALPPHFSAHVKTHIYRYQQNPQDPNGVWIDSELIDEFAVIDPGSRYQESHYFLSNPTNAQFRDGNLAGQASPNDPDITISGGDGEGTADNPVRLDPFQNIVNYSSGVYVLVSFKWADQVSTSLGERCTLVSTTPNPITSVLTDGEQSTVTQSDAIGVDYIGVTGASAVMLNTPTVVVTEKAALGYPKFPEDCFDCTSSAFIIVYPPSDPKSGSNPGGNPCPDLPLAFADPVPFNQFEKSFLLDVAPSDGGDPTADASKVEFNLLGIPDPKPYSIFERALETYTGGDGFDEYINDGTSNLQFEIRVYDKSAVDIYLTDQICPLRKKGIDPTGASAATETLEAWKTFTSYSSEQYIDAENELHEGLSEAESVTGTGGSTGGGAVMLLLPFERFTVGPGQPVFAGSDIAVKRPILWPEQPASIEVEAVLSGSIDEGDAVIGARTIRRYSYFWKVNGNVQTKAPSPIEIKFGTNPLGTIP